MFTGPYGVFEDGADSEWLAVRKESLCRIPEGIDDVSAASIPVAYLTAHMARTHNFSLLRAAVQSAPGFAYTCATPPSTNNSVPVTWLPSSDARNSAAFAISSGVPNLPSGIPLEIVCMT